MPRNLERRLELMTPIYDSTLQNKLGEILRMQLGDNELAFELGSDGEYTPAAPSERKINAQEFFEIYMNKIFSSMKKGNDNDKVQILASKLLKES